MQLTKSRKKFRAVQPGRHLILAFLSLNPRLGQVATDTSIQSPFTILNLLHRKISIFDVKSQQVFTFFQGGVPRFTTRVMSWRVSFCIFIVNCLSNETKTVSKLAKNIMHKTETSNQGIIRVNLHFQWFCFSDLEGAARGWSLREKKEKTIILGTQSKVLAGWPKRFRLVQATAWADFAVITAQLWSTMTAIFSWVNNFAFNCYLRPRFY